MCHQGVGKRHEHPINFRKGRFDAAGTSLSVSNNHRRRVCAHFLVWAVQEYNVIMQVGSLSATVAPFLTNWGL